MIMTMMMIMTMVMMMTKMEIKRIINKNEDDDKDESLIIKKDDHGCDDNGSDVHDINLDDDRKQVMMPNDNI